jgi:RNA-directed DNA polymerase
MMHGRGKSDSVIVAMKPANKAEPSAAESGEPRAGTKGNASQQSTRRTQSRENVSQALDRIRQVARQRKKERFTALFHHISVDLLRTAFFALKRDAAAGVDGLKWQDYEADLERNLEDLHARVQRGAYRALPSRRQYISKPDGRQRPLAIAALEDKVVQRATAAVLNGIYEEDFLGFSYAFRPKRGQHDALDALVVGITSKKVNYILDADIQGFFDAVSQTWLVRFLEHQRRWLLCAVSRRASGSVVQRHPQQRRYWKDRQVRSLPWRRQRARTAWHVRSFDERPRSSHQLSAVSAHETDRVG